MDYYTYDKKKLAEDLRELIREEVLKIVEVLENKSDNKPLTIEQVAARYDVSKKTVYNWIKKKIISGVKIGNKRFFSIQEIEKNVNDPRYWDVLESKGLKEKRRRID